MEKPCNSFADAGSRSAVDDVLGLLDRFRDYPILHVIDLDAAMRKGSNSGWIKTLCKRGKMKVRVGGGIRTVARAERILSWGARNNRWQRRIQEWKGRLMNKRFIARKGRNNRRCTNIATSFRSEPSSVDGSVSPCRRSRVVQTDTSWFFGSSPESSGSFSGNNCLGQRRPFGPTWCKSLRKLVACRGSAGNAAKQANSECGLSRFRAGAIRARAGFVAALA